MDYSFPEDFDPVAKDLVQKLLQKESENRLGTGRKGTDKDFDTLKKHPFFAGVNFSEVLNSKPPRF